MRLILSLHIYSFNFIQRRKCWSIVGLSIGKYLAFLSPFRLMPAFLSYPFQFTMTPKYCHCACSQKVSELYLLVGYLKWGPLFSSVSTPDSRIKHVGTGGSHLIRIQEGFCLISAGTLVILYFFWFTPVLLFEFLCSTLKCTIILIFLSFHPTIAISTADIAWHWIRWYVGKFQNLPSKKWVILQYSQSKAEDIVWFGSNLKI